MTNTARLLIATLALTGCVSAEATCAERPSGPGCDDAAMDAGTRLDGGETDAGDRDAGEPIDAGTDASASDAGPCGGGCDGDYCVDGACVACTAETADSDCGDPTPYCSEEGACVACTAATAATDCGDPTPYCSEEGACVACTAATAATDCGGNTPICDEETQECRGCDESPECEARDGDFPGCRSDGSCVACVSEAHCGGMICNQIDNTCTTITPGSVGACRICVSSAQCASTEACVESTFDDETGGVVTEYVCLPKQADESPLCARPFVVAQSWPSAEGPLVAVCASRNTSCAAYRQFSTEQGTCTGGEPPTDNMDNECGEEDVADGLCESGDAGNRCTFRCASNDDCPMTTDCFNPPMGYCDV